jgi:anti-sigma regulatory factor (Ser/Thr protein kinase)
VSDPALIGPIDIGLPPDPALTRVVRLAASAVASLGGFTVDAIDDIQIAASEVLTALIEHGDGHPIAVQLRLDADGFSISAAAEVEHFDVDHPDLQLSRAVLAAVCGDHRIDVEDHRVLIWASVSDHPTG